MIKLENVCRKFGDQIVINNVSLELKEKKIYGFIGRNGSGKSVLFKIICGFIVPDSGDVIINNKNIYKTDSFPENVAALIEKPKFIGNLSGLDNLKLLAGINNKISEKDICGLLKRLDLYDEKDKLYKKYSLGMKQKLGIIQVLMENPEIMIFDEPFNGLDDETTDVVRNLLLEEKRKGKIILISSHIKEDIEKLCDCVYRINNGKVLENEKM